MTATSLSLFCLNARKFMKPTWNYSKENFENKVNAASLGCFLLAPDANLSWTDAQLFCERVNLIFYPAYLFLTLSVLSSETLSSTIWHICDCVCYPLIQAGGYMAELRTPQQASNHNSEFPSSFHLQTLFHLQTFFPTSLHLKIRFHLALQASLVSSLAHLLSSASSIKHWWVMLFLKYSCHRLCHCICLCLCICHCLCICLLVGQIKDVCMQTTSQVPQPYQLVQTSSPLV